MCRLAAFPPYFPRRRAMDILLDFAMSNEDGTGSAFVKDGQFVVQKWPFSLAKVLKKGYPFLDHMPYPGWTVAHLRLASHGDNTMENTHPFVVGNWCVCHNGIWSDHSIVKAALSKFAKFHGETDSEVAANLINIIGPQKFVSTVDYGGVFLALHKNGGLWALKVSGDLEVMKYHRKYILASKFSGLDGTLVPSGYLRLNTKGRIDKIYKKPEKSFSYSSYNYGKKRYDPDDDLPPITPAAAASPIALISPPAPRPENYVYAGGAAAPGRTRSMDLVRHATQDRLAQQYPENKITARRVRVVRSTAPRNGHTIPHNGDVAGLLPFAEDKRKDDEDQCDM